MRVVAESVREQMGSASWIRKMFEAGLELKKKFGVENVYDFSLGNPDIPPPAAARDILLELAESATEPLGLGYCPNAGLPALREALAERLTREQGVELEGSHIVVTCGAAGALTSLFRAVLEPGDEVLCPAPYFVEYGAYCGHFGGTLRAIPALKPDFAPDVAAMEGAISERTRAIIINSPNNPAGCIYSQAVLERLAEVVNRVNEGRERPLLLISDEPYRFLAYDGAVVPPILSLSPFAIVLGSFSKSLSLAGERIGYLAVNPAMPEVEVVLGAVTMTNRTLGFVNAPVIGQRMVLGLLDEGVDLEIYSRRREAMAKVLSAAGIRFHKPEGAFYFFPEAPGGDDHRFVQALLRHNILAVPGAGFGFGGHFRLSFSVDERVIARSAAGFAAAVAEVGGE